MTMKKKLKKVIEEVEEVAKEEEEELVEDDDEVDEDEVDEDDAESDAEAMDDNDDDDDDDDKENDSDDDDDDDDYFSNVEAASYWSSWSEENVHVIGLVDNDVVKRTRALKKLRLFLKTRSAEAENAFEEKDLLKIWKGLHFCMWHSDKLLVQQELAGTLADLIFCFETTPSAVLFVRCFYLTIVREWDGIDAHRLNKFLTLIRRVWRSSLLFLKKLKWEAQVVADILQILRETMIKPNASSADGLTFHMIDIYVDELTKVGGFGKDAAAAATVTPPPSALTRDGLFDFVRPYVVFSLKEKNRLLLKAVVRDVFDALVSQVEEDFLDNLDEDGFEMHGKIDNQKLEGPLDKGAGIEEGPGTRLAVDFSRVGGYILKLAGGKKVAAFNRKILYQIAATFENLSKGIYPWEEIEVEENEGKKKDGLMTKDEIAKAVRRMEKDNERIDAAGGDGGEGGGGKKTRKRRKKTMDVDMEEGEEEGGGDADHDDDGDNDDDGGEPTTPPPSKKKKRKDKTETSSSSENKNNKQDSMEKKLKTSSPKKGIKIGSEKKQKGKMKEKGGKGGKNGGLKVSSRSGAWTVKAS